MEYKDYYKILGVGKGATKDEIQRAYRKLARKFHPDVNKATDAQAKFIEINEAYEVLKDPEKRQHYDQYGQSWRDAQQGQPPPGKGGERFSRTFHFGSDGDFNFQGEGFSDFFQNLFGGMGRDFSGGRGSPFDFTARQQARHIEAELGISLDEAFHGATKTITLQNWVTGKDGTMQPNQRILQVKIPRGVKNGSVIRLAGQGGAAGSGTSGPDLLCTIRIMPHHLFRVVGHDLHTIVEITPWEAALGGKVEVNTVGGKVMLKIPEGTRNGRRFHLRGKGLPRQAGSAGDIIVTVEIRVPHPLSTDEKKLFEMLAKKSTFNPRSKGGQRASDDGDI